jgi:DNA recombination protein RmuC
LHTVVNHFNASSKEFKKMDKDVMRITETGVDLDIPLIEKPEGEE